MALNHVAKRASRLIETAATLDSQRLRGGNLHMIYVVAIPERLENAITETKHEQVLHRVFAKVVIDAVDLLFFEHTQYNFVQFLGGGQIAAEGLLDDDARPCGWTRRMIQSGATNLLHDVRINFRRRGQVQKAIPTKLLFFV